VKDLQLSRSRYMMGGLSVLLILSFLVGFLFVRQNKLKSQQRSMQLEQKLLRSQMNPHFIFNSLTAIESFIYTNEPKEAGRYLSGFARLMRLILENSREEFISLEKEIKTLQYYLDLQKLRFDDKFDYKIILEDGLEADSIAIPPMLAQPFIENSIEHGIKNMELKGAIEILFKKENNEIHFEVKDNGIGMERSFAIKEDKKSHQSLATKITRERLSILNRSKQGKIKLLIEEMKDAFNNVVGTQVSFNIPLREI
jgi:LytS/YehU family sensor histidine kinase